MRAWQLLRHTFRAQGCDSDIAGRRWSSKLLISGFAVRMLKLGKLASDSKSDAAISACNERCPFHVASAFPLARRGKGLSGC